MQWKTGYNLLQHWKWIPKHWHCSRWRWLNQTCWLFWETKWILVQQLLKRSSGVRLPHPWHYSKSNWGGAATTVARKKGCFGINPQCQGIPGMLLPWFKSSAGCPPCFAIVSAEFQTKNLTFLKIWQLCMTTWFQTGLTGTSQNRLLLWPPSTALVLLPNFDSPTPHEIPIRFYWREQVAAVVIARSFRAQDVHTGYFK